MGLIITEDILRDAFFELSEHPDSYSLWEDLGDIYRERLITEKARKCYMTALEIYRDEAGNDASNPPVFEKFAAAHEKLSKDPVRKAHLEIVSMLSSGVSIFNLYTEAQRLVSIYPDSHQLLNAHAMICLVCAGESLETLYADEGMRVCSKAVVIDPSEPSHCLYLASLYIMLGDPENGSALLQNARILIDANMPLGIASHPTDYLEDHFLEVQNELNM